MGSLGLKSGALALLMALGVAVEMPSTVSAEDAPRTQRLLERGPYGTGRATIPFVDASRPTMANGSFAGAATRTLTTQVWYPAKDDAQVDVVNAKPGKAKDGFPLIVYGHGLGSQSTDIAHVATHLASYGYVVASVQFPLSNASAPGGPTANDVTAQPTDLIYVSQAIVSAPIKAAFPFASTIDSTRIGLMGYSLGGVSAALASQYPTVDAVATLAPAACGLYLPGGPGLTVNKPLLVVSGETDAVTPVALNGDPLFNAAHSGPKYNVHIANGSHGGFIATAPVLESYAPAGFSLDAVICSAVPAGATGPTGPLCQVCLPQSLPGKQLAALRQQEIQKAAVLSFFDGYLRDERRDQQYLKNGLEHENPELVVTYEGPANQ
jgi:predicted dienelactone hydrolase